MSGRKGAKNKGPVPKYQNSYAFHHNKASSKTKKIMEIPATEGCCRHCANVIEWKRKYRKYKPLSRLRKCVKCLQLKVRLAYHTQCGDCCRRHNSCAKCMRTREEQELVNQEIEEIDRQLDILTTTKGSLPGITERERRTMIRELTQEKARLLEMDCEDMEEEHSRLDKAAMEAEHSEKEAKNVGIEDEEPGDEDDSSEGAEDSEEEEDDDEEEEFDESDYDAEEEEKESAAPTKSNLRYDGLVDTSIFTRALQEAKRRMEASGL